MNMTNRLLAVVLMSVSCVAAGAAMVAPQVVRENVAGITNFARLETTIACAGATSPESLAAVRKMGFASVINLRQASEAGANIDAEMAAAKSAGLRYVHLPLNSASPDPAVVDQFLTTIADQANQPAFVHCASGNRAAAVWMIKRVIVDRWDVDKAGEEAAALGLTSSALKTFALSYIESRRR